MILRPKSLRTTVFTLFSRQPYGVKYYFHPSAADEETEAQRLANLLKVTAIGVRKETEPRESELSTTTLFLSLFFPEMKTLTSVELFRTQENTI